MARERSRLKAHSIGKFDELTGDACVDFVEISIVGKAAVQTRLRA